MAPESIFSFCSGIAFIGWIILIFLPFWKNRQQYVFSIIILLLAIIYTWLIFSNMQKDILESFGTLEGVSSLFTNKTVLLAGWVHYLAFDLLAGIFITRNASLNKVNHWITTPALLFTFLFGPFGLLIYFLIVSIKRKQFFTDL